MSNKRIIKKVFDKEFNVEDIRNQILKKENKFKRVFYKLSISICLTIIVCFAIILNNNLAFKNKSNKIVDIININKIKKTENIKSDIDGKADDIEIEEVYNFYPNIKSIYIPNNLNNVRNIKMFSRKNLSDDYTIFDGFNIMYSNGEENTKNIEIFLSKTLKSKRRDILFNSNYKNSVINGTELIILLIGNKYIVNFKYDNIYFDIETNNISKNELITLIKSIVSNEENKIIEIVDKTQNDFNCAEALEQFYEDETNIYYWNCIKNNLMIVRYKNGCEEIISDALKSGIITIKDLDDYNISYIRERKYNKCK